MKPSYCALDAFVIIKDCLANVAKPCPQLELQLTSSVEPHLSSMDRLPIHFLAIFLDLLLCSANHTPKHPS